MSKEVTTIPKPNKDILEAGSAILNNTEPASITTDLLISLAQSILKISLEIQTNLEYNKQYELGRVIYHAKIAIQDGNSNVKMKDLYSGIGVNKRTANDWQKFYSDRTEFKELLSLEGAASRPSLPAMEISNSLKGETAKEKLDYLDTAKEYFEDEPTRDNIREFNKVTKNISQDVGCDQWQVTADEVREYVEEQKEVISSTPSKTSDTNNKPTEPAATKHIKLTTEEEEDFWTYYSGFNFKSSWKQREDLKIETILTDNYLKTLANSALFWKQMYRKGSKLFHPDTGGSDQEMNLWSTIARIIENSIQDKAYKDASTESWNQRNQMHDYIKEHPEEISEWYKQQKDK